MAPLFFLSGFSALLYQIAWAKRLGLVLGADAYAVSFVLFAFMAGFASGGKIGGRWADRARNGASLYGKLELAIGFFGALSPWLFAGLLRIYPAIYAASESSEWLRFPLRALAALIVLMPPAILMGASFPAMAKLLASAGAIGRGTARFYAWNTLGACAGALICGFLLVPQLGIHGTIFLAAAINAVVGVVALRMTVPVAEWKVPTSSSTGAAILRAVFLSGFAALVFEVVLTRNLAINLGATSYAFATVLFVFLLGMGLGAKLFRSRWEESESAKTAFAGLQLVAAGLGILCPFALEWAMPHLFLARPSYFPGVDSISRLWLWQFLVSAAAMLPLGVALGLAFPIAIRVAAGKASDLGSTAGRVYWWNTWGAACGALAATFLLIPWLGSRAAIACAAGASLLAAWQIRKLFVASLPVVALGAAFLIFGARQNENTILFLEGPSASVSVEDVPLPDGRIDRAFRINGRVEASTGLLDMRLQRLLGSLPALLHPDPRRALVVGLGAGVTAGASASSERVHSVRVVELNPEVKRAADLFGAVNHFPILPSGKMRITFADAGNYLLATQERFDVITSDPIHPWTAGSGNLYTVEYFQRMRERLAEDGRGIVGQWVPLYQLSMRDIGSIFASFRVAFPHAEIWLTSVDLVLLGSLKPIEVSESELERRMHALIPGAERDFEEIGIRSAADLLALRFGGTELVDSFAADAPLNRDLRPFLEYSAPFSVLVPYQVEFYDRLLASYPKPANAAQEKVKKALQSFLAPLRKKPPQVDDAVGAFWEALR